MSLRASMPGKAGAAAPTWAPYTGTLAPSGVPPAAASCTQPHALPCMPFRPTAKPGGGSLHVAACVLVTALVTALGPPPARRISYLPAAPLAHSRPRPPHAPAHLPPMHVCAWAAGRSWEVARHGRGRRRRQASHW